MINFNFHVTWIFQLMQTFIGATFTARSCDWRKSSTTTEPRSRLVGRYGWPSEKHDTRPDVATQHQHCRGCRPPQWGPTAGTVPARQLQGTVVRSSPAPAPAPRPQPATARLRVPCFRSRFFTPTGSQCRQSPPPFRVSSLRRRHCVSRHPRRSLPRLSRSIPRPWPPRRCCGHRSVTAAGRPPPAARRPSPAAARLAGAAWDFGSVSLTGHAVGRGPPPPPLSRRHTGYAPVQVPVSVG